MESFSIAGLAGAHAVRWTRSASRWRGRAWPFRRLSFLENGDEHRRNILQAILRFGAIEKGGVLPKLVRHLVNDEGAAGPERVVSVLEKGAFLFDLENAERDAGEDVIALRDAAAAQLLGEAGGVAIDDVDARIVGKLPLEVARESADPVRKGTTANPRPCGRPARASERLRPDRTRRSCAAG